MPAIAFAANPWCDEKVFNEIALRRKGLAAPTTTSKPKEIAPHLDANLEAVRKKSLPPEPSRPAPTIRQELGRSFAEWVKPKAKEAVAKLKAELDRFGLIWFRGSDQVRQAAQSVAKTEAPAPLKRVAEAVAPKVPESAPASRAPQPSTIAGERKAKLSEELAPHLREIRAAGPELRSLRRIAERENSVSAQRDLLNALRAQAEHAQEIRTRLIHEGNSDLDFEDLKESKIAQGVLKEVERVEQRIARLESPVLPEARKAEVAGGRAAGELSERLPVQLGEETRQATKSVTEPTPKARPEPLESLESLRADREQLARDIEKMERAQPQNQPAPARSVAVEDAAAREEAVKALGRDPFSAPRLFSADNVITHALDEKGRLVAEVQRNADGTFSVRAFNRLKADARLDSKIADSISDGLTVRADSKINGVGTVVTIEFYGKQIGRYIHDGERFSIPANSSPRLINRFDISRFANDPEFVSRVKQGKENWAPFRSGTKSFSFSELHTHLTGAVEADSLVGIGLMRDMRYPEKLLREVLGDVPLKLEPDGNVRLKSLTPEQLNHLIARMQIFPDHIGSFEKDLNKIYEFRRPFSTSPELFADVLHQSARELARSGTTFVQYAHTSTHYSPEFLAMLSRELPKIERETGVKVQMIYGILRTKEVGAIKADLERFGKIKSPHVVGIDFLGEETESLDRLRRRGVGKVLHDLVRENPGLQVRFHAGESPDFPKNVAMAVEMGANRIGHGTFGFIGPQAEETLATIKKMERKWQAEFPGRRVFVETQRGSNIALDYVREGKIVQEMDAFLRRNGIPHGSYTDGHGIYTSTPRGEFAVSASSGGRMSDLLGMRASERRIFSDSLGLELQRARKMGMQGPELEILQARKDLNDLQLAAFEKKILDMDPEDKARWYMNLTSELREAEFALSRADSTRLPAVNEAIARARASLADPRPPTEPLGAALLRRADDTALVRAKEALASLDARIESRVEAAKVSAANEELSRGARRLDGDPFPSGGAGKAEISGSPSAVARAENTAPGSTRGPASQAPPRLSARERLYEARKALVAEGREIAASGRRASSLNPREAEALRAYENSKALKSRVEAYRRNLASLPETYEGPLSAEDAARISNRLKRQRERNASRFAGEPELSPGELRQAVNACIR